MLLGLCFLFASRPVNADTPVDLLTSFAGNMNFIGIQKTLRTQPDTGNSCLINTGATTATLSTLPAGATVTAAYLYWAASGDTPDYTVTFDGNIITSTAARSYTATYAGTYNYFSGVADVTSIVAARRNYTYSFANLTVNNGDPWCASSAVLGGWALAVIFSEPSEDFRVINVYEGFQALRGSSVTLTPSNFTIPTSPINGLHAHVTWEGDVGNSATLGGFSEELTFNGNVLTDGNNPPNNQFNSVSTITTPADTASYGVDFDVYDITTYLTAGDTSATSVYSSGGDLVMLSGEIISTTNIPVADLGITMTRNGNLVPGQNQTYTLNVINNGPLSEPGPITIVDTLPADLSYVSASGTGWSCSAVGQTVTCNRTGAIANGASAPALTLTIAVGATASGVKTNSATVSGQAFDNVSTNDTATDSYTMPNTNQYAFYGMEEISWSGAGSVIDDRGNSNGSPVGGVTPGLPTPATPPDTCHAANIPNNTATGTFDAINTNIDVNATIGNRGTISFWFKSNTDWNAGGNRMLLDASNNLGNNNADKFFFLMKQNNGRLRFRLEDSADTDTQALTSTNAFAANTWQHIAITWDLPNDRTRIYINGVLRDTSTTNVNGNLGNTNTLYLGDNRTTGVSGNGYSGNSANGEIDEVRIYTYVQGAVEITTDMNTARPCVSVDHYAISPSGTGITCEALAVRITAHDTGHAAVAPANTTQITVSTNPAADGWALKAGGNPASFADLGSGSASYTFDGSENFVELWLTETTATTAPHIDIDVTDGTNTDQDGNATEDPNAVFVDTLFRITDATPAAVNVAQPQIAGKGSNIAPNAQTLYLQGIRTDTASGSCVGVFQNQNNVSVEMASECNNPAACEAPGGPGRALSVLDNTSTYQAIGINNAGLGSNNYNSVNLNFDADSKAPLTFRYADVGQMTLHFRKTITADATATPPITAATLTGSSNAFVVRPFGFYINLPGNPAATDATGGVFTSAGTDFSVNVQAVLWQSADDDGSGGVGVANDGIPDGHETTDTDPSNNVDLSDNAAALNYGQETTTEQVLLNSLLNQPAAGNDPGLDDSSADGKRITSFAMATGIGTSATLNFDEVGIIEIYAAVNDANYLGLSAAETAKMLGRSGYVGRITPAYFDVVATEGCTAGATNFTYSGQGFTAQVTAKNAGAATTQNYDGGFVKSPVISNAGDATNFSNNTLTSAYFTASNGIGSRSDVTYTFASKTTAPLSMTNIRAVDTDSITSDTHIEGSNLFRSGRVVIDNAFGSELIDLNVPMRAEYYDGSNFVTHTDDACSVGVTLSLLSPTDTVTVGDGTTRGQICVQDVARPGVSGEGCSAAGPASEQYTGTPAAGIYTLFLRSPDTPATFDPNNPIFGNVTVRGNVPAYLQYDWNGDGFHTNDPTGIATFGQYRGDDRIIYWREVFD